MTSTGFLFWHIELIRCDIQFFHYLRDDFATISATKRYQVFALVVVEFKVFDSFKYFYVELFFYKFSLYHRVWFEFFIVDDYAIDFIYFCDFSLIFFFFLLLGLFRLFDLIQHDTYGKVTFPENTLKQIS